MTDARSEAPTFTEEQRAELVALIAEATKGGEAPPPDALPKDAPKVTDAEWDSMSDRHKQSWIKSVVDHHLGELSRKDADAERDARLAELEARKAPEPERAPSVWSRLQGVLWGQPDAG